MIKPGDKIPGGYILQPRIIDGSELSSFPPVTRELWSYLLRKVNHSRNDRLNINRGQGFFRFEDIQNDLAWYSGYRKNVYSKPQLTKSLRRLREGNMVATAKETRGILITICNYDFYQDSKNYEGNNGGSAKELRRDLEGRTINKNDIKNDKNDNKTTKAVFNVPEWVDKEMWNAFLQMRVKIKKPVTSQIAVTRLINKLKVLIDNGYSQIDIMGEALEKNWQSFYEPKKSLNQDGGPKPTTYKQKQMEDISNLLKASEAHDDLTRKNGKNTNQIGSPLPRVIS